MKEEVVRDLLFFCAALCPPFEYSALGFRAFVGQGAVDAERPPALMVVPNSRWIRRYGFVKYCCIADRGYAVCVTLLCAVARQSNGRTFTINWPTQRSPQHDQLQRSERLSDARWQMRTVG